jgi:hypothetical protein
LFAILDRRAQPLAILTRNLMEHGKNFEDAFDILTKTDMIAPAYFIIGGTRSFEGAVITRNQNEVINIWMLNETSTEFDKWFLLETNYDHWKPQPPNDDRRDPGINALNKIGQDRINEENLFEVLSMEPINNPGTIYSVVMSAIQENAFIRIAIR